MYHTASNTLYRRDANNLTEMKKRAFATVCNRSSSQYDVQIRLEWRGLESQQKQDTLRKEAIFSFQIWQPPNILSSNVNTKQTAYWRNLKSHNILNMSFQGMSRNSSGGIVPEPCWISKEGQFDLREKQAILLRTAAVSTALPFTQNRGGIL